MSDRIYRASMTLAFIIFTVAIASVLHGNPFGESGTISWVASLAIAAFGNALLAFALAPRIGPYLVGSGQRYTDPAQREPVDPARSRPATLATAVVTMLVSLVCLWGVGYAASDPIFVPTERLERNAELARSTIKEKAPAEFQGTIGAADTWRIEKDGDEFRTCVPAKDDRMRAWCVTIRATNDSATIVEYGRGEPNAVLFLEQQGSSAEKVEE
jgi:hypothetical protein